MAARLPRLRIVFLLREPVDRLWSHLRFHWERFYGRPLRPDDDPMQIRRAAFHESRLVRGDYRRTVERWEQHFPRDQLRYLLYDDIAAAPHEPLAQVLEHLGADPMPPRPDDRRPVNASKGPPIPDALAAELAARYADQIPFLEAKLDRSLAAWRREP